MMIFSFCWKWFRGVDVIMISEALAYGAVELYFVEETLEIMKMKMTLKKVRVFYITRQTGDCLCVVQC